MKTHKFPRVLALLTVGALSTSALLQPVTAHADKAKNYKYGAVALGVVGGYLLSKGKTVAGAAVLGAGAYTYKKGEDARKAEKNDRYGYGDNNYDGRYSANPIYPDARDDTRYRNRDRYDDSRYDDRNYDDRNDSYRVR